MAISGGLLADVPSRAVVTVDSAPIIYFLEDHPTHAEYFAELFDAAAEGRISAVISPITLAEVLSGPLRSGNEVLAARYRETLCHSSGWSLRPMDEEVAVTAARVRVRYRLRLPDAIQIATAITTGSHALVTHDRALAKIRDIAVIGIR